MNRIRIPVTNTDALTRVKQIINERYQAILRHEDWFWTVTRYVVNTASDFNWGTVTIVQGATSFTFSNVATGLGSFVGAKLLVPTGTPDSLAVYRIAAHTANQATGSVDVAYSNPSAVNAAFHVYTDEYDLPTNFGKFADLQRFGYRVPARPVGPADMLMLKGSDTTVGKPMRYTVYDFETSGDPTTQRRMWVHPYPDQFYRMEVYY